MIVGVDARAATEVPAGRGRVVRELLLQWQELDLPHELLLYCREPWTDLPSHPRLRWARIQAPDPVWHLVAAIRAGRACDVFLSTNSYLTAWLLRPPSVVLVHDLIAFRADARAQARAARIERTTIRPAIRRAGRLVCNSRSTERDLLELFPLAAGKTSVVPFAAGPVFSAEPLRDVDGSALRRQGVAPGAFVLVTGTLEPRKNLTRLIRAHGDLSAELRARYPLLIAGPRGWEAQEVVRLAGDSPDVRLAGYVPDAELAALYRSCAVFCYPSLYEGFGLPVLEALACGAPTLTSSVSSLPEVGGDAVAYVDPTEADSIRAALERLLGSPDERRELSARGRARAAEFSWRRAALSLLDELELAHASMTRS